MVTVFADRHDAGRALVPEVRSRGLSDPVVLALPRGGVPVAYEIAAALGAPLDVIVVRKLGVPWQPELALGAIASGGVRVLNEEVVRNLTDFDEAAIEAIADDERRELERRERRYRGERPYPALAGRDVLLVDDGMATGSTMRAAAEAVRALGPARLLVAVPTASVEAVAAVDGLVDEVICLQSPAEFYAVGLYYRDFRQTSDDEVREYLERARRPPAPAPAKTIRRRTAMLEIDGSQGEGGGQVLRTALSLSIVTGTAFRMFDIRARRRKPGLRPQHLTAVRAAQAVSRASVTGDSIGSAEITFQPGRVRPGDYVFDVGTAGSTTLIAQTLIPPLMLATGPSAVTLTGGTHNPLSPPFEFLARSYAPLLDRMGPRLHLTLARPGYYPAGGGRFEMAITPAAELSPFDLSNRGRLLDRMAEATVCHLHRGIAERELATIREALGWPGDATRLREDRLGRGPGNVLLVVLEFERITSVFAGFGERGVSAERVAGGVAARVREYLESGAAVDSHLADQLLVPMALAAGGRFTTLCPTRHARTNIRIIETFLPVRFDVSRGEDASFHVRVSAGG